VKSGRNHRPDWPAALAEGFAAGPLACYNGDSTESPGFPTSVKLMATPKPLANYTSYRGLPPLAGLCMIEEAARPGLSVEECVRRLKRFHYAFKRLHEILVARLTAEPIYELKTGFAHHAYLCAEHITALRPVRSPRTPRDAAHVVHG
jgi:hypothetical protein